MAVPNTLRCALVCTCGATRKLFSHGSIGLPSFAAPSPLAALLAAAAAAAQHSVLDFRWRGYLLRRV